MVMLKEAAQSSGRRPGVQAPALEFFARQAISSVYASILGTPGQSQKTDLAGLPDHANLPPGPGLSCVWGKSWAPKTSASFQALVSLALPSSLPLSWLPQEG